MTLTLTAYDFLPSKAAVAIFFTLLLGGVFASMAVMLGAPHYS